MPTYDYQCQGCGVYHEIICSMSARQDEIECPLCHATAEQVILSAPGVLTGGMSNMTQDVAIGKDAEQRWSGIHERRAIRDKIRRDMGTKNLTVRPDGTGFQRNDKKLDFVATKGTERED